MKSFAKLALGAATLGMLVFSFCPQARAQAAPAPGEAPGGGGKIPPRLPNGNEPYQYVPLPKELPKGVTVQDAQRQQALIDSYGGRRHLTVTKIKGNVYFGFEGGAGNLGFAVGKTSVIVVLGNSGRTVHDGLPEGKELLDEIAKITPKPVKTVLLLSGAFEGAVAAFPAGVTVIAQENAKKDLENAVGDAVIPPAYLPTKTIDKDETMKIDGVRVRLLHWAPAYTDGDLVVYFPDEKVVFTGNLLINDFPLAATVIDRLYLHGTVAGWIESVKGILALNADAYASGHGPIYTKRDVRIKLAFIQDKWDKIKVMVAQGKSLDEVKAAIDGPQGNLERIPSTTENIYSELTAK